MALDDVVGVSVSRDHITRPTYRGMLINLGLRRIMEVDPVNRSTKDAAEEVASYAKDIPAVLLTDEHSDIAFWHNEPDVGLVVFDRLVDDHHEYDYVGITSSNFLNHRRGKVYVVGSKEKPRNKLIRVYSPDDAEGIIKQQSPEEQLPDKILLSLDIQAFGSDVTQAHYYTPPGFLERAVDSLRGKKTTLSDEDVTSLSIQLAKHRQLLGINISGYIPSMEKFSYPTSDKLSNYLRAVLNVISQPK